MIIAMEILESYSFTKPSTSRYAAAVSALVEDGHFAVKLKRGTDFPAEIGIEAVQGAISEQIRKRGKRARTFRESDDVLVVSLYGDGEGPRRRRGARRQAAVAA